MMAALGLLLVFAAVGVYFLPSIWAELVKHPHTDGIFFANLLFGWTFVGWGLCMIWALVPVRPLMARNG